ncbi:MAG: DNA-directed RNA polymerase subunit alpha [Mariprofundaceae bacterium]|nr:DNA-directed RNA polymerase subunit alpha [Mariprofundaceae bacterium]
MELIKPREVRVEEIVPGRSAKIIFEPLERGYGTSLGNSIRRMLLSSLSGAAVSAIRIDGVMHEFDIMKGVREDVMDIILSLKNLDMKMFGHGDRTLSLDVQGPAVVTAGDLTGPADIQILNPSLVLAHLNEDAHLHLEAVVEKGRGYVPAQERKHEEKPVGTLLVDASFSPVRKVAVHVDNARVSQKTNYDKLILEVETNGSITPEEAVGSAARIIQDQLAIFVDFNAHETQVYVEDNDQGLIELLSQPIEHLDLSVRSMNCLKSDNVFYVGDLVIRTEQEMLRTPNFGRKSLTEIKEVLQRMNLELGMSLEGWPPENLGGIIEIEESTDAAS